MSEAPAKLVLVVEDDEDCRYVYGEFLNFSGYESHAVADATSAIEWLKTSPVPSLVILDLTLPGMSPKDFAGWMRDEPRLAVVPILVLSGRHDIVDQAKELGASGYVKKPCDLGPLTDEVNRLMSMSSSKP